MYLRDTIAAISTPVGEGGIGIIRVSGPAAETIGRAIFRGVKNGGFQSHLFYYGAIVDPSGGGTLDEGMAVLMRAPRSYTREDVLELHCHGGYLVVQRVLELVLRQGARLAHPGEFTRRAFLNGRLDLLQAEAVIDVIRSKTDASLALAQHQRAGLLSRRVNELRDLVLRTLALIEAYIDFPEEDIDHASAGEIGRRVREAMDLADRLLAGFDEGRALREGASVLIAGKPNAGKSSLLNTLLRERRAIVTAVPGTTRDIIEEVVNVKGLPIRLLDTAGIRETEDLVEMEGMRLTLEQIPLADLVLFVVDSSRPFEAEDRMLLDALAGKRVIVVRNKCDLPPLLDLPDTLAALPLIPLSALTGDGIDRLREEIFSIFIHDAQADSREFALLSRARHRDALAGTRRHLSAFLDGHAAGLEPVLLAADLRDALAAIGEVTGETTPDDLLDLIFSQFCIGK